MDNCLKDGGRNWRITGGLLEPGTAAKSLKRLIASLEIFQEEIENSPF
jgi:hypothetical protein